MSGFYGVNYKINGHRVGVVHALAGEYRVIFERCYEENTLEASRPSTGRMSRSSRSARTILPARCRKAIPFP